MGATQHDPFVLAGRVVLAHEQPFALGSLHVDPARRQVRGGGRSETVEPRVMQVLVALARAGGEVVTREELTEYCWSGRIVGDDSINRALSRIRRIAAGIGQGTFSIETIPRVGYRLQQGAQSVTLDERPGRIEPNPVPEGGGLSRRRLVGVIAGAAGVVVLGAGAWGTLRRTAEPPLAARLFYERGVEARGQGSANFGEQAVAYFRQATQLAPDYAEAWGALAWGYRGLLEYGPRKDAAAIAMLSRSAANRALELDADNADARAALLLLKPFYRNWAEIERGCRELLRRHPGHSITRYNLGHLSTEIGRWRDAIPHFQLVAEQEPFWPLGRIDLFRALSTTGRHEEAEEQMQTVLRLWPRRPDFWSTRVRHLLLTGRASDAQAYVADERFQPVDSDRLVEQGQAIVQAYVTRSPSLRQQALDGLLADGASNPRALFLAAIDASMLGEVDLSFALFEGIIFGRGRWAEARAERPSTRILFNLMTRPLRRDRRFQPLVEEIGLEKFWRDSGLQPDFRSYPEPL